MRYLLASALLVLSFMVSSVAWGNEPVEISQEWRWVEVTFGEYSIPITVYKRITVVRRGDEVLATTMLDAHDLISVIVDSSSDE